MSKAAIYPTHNRWVYPEAQLKEIYAKKQKEYQRIISSFSVLLFLDLQKNLPQQAANGQNTGQSGRNSLPGNGGSQISQIHNEGRNETNNQGGSSVTSSGLNQGGQMDGGSDNLGSSKDQNAIKAPQFDLNDEKTLLAFHVSRLLLIIKEVGTLW